MTDVGWLRMSLKDAGVAVLDCVHQTPPAARDGYPYVAIPQLKQGRLDLSEARRITQEHLAKWTLKAKPKAHDVILSRRCNPGETAYVPPGFEGALGQNLVLLRADGHTVFPPFLRWLTRGRAWWDQVDKFINVGAVFDSLRCADIPGFTLTIPPLPVQRTVAALLGALDDKIELNRRMNETLEEIARALFKSWFVDFDPVHAKAAGKKPFGMDDATAALFPSGFGSGDSDLIPLGWERIALNDLPLQSGGTPPKSQASYWGGDIPWISAKAFDGMFVHDSEDRVTHAGASSGTRLVPAGTVLFVVRGMSLATEFRVAAATRPVTFNQDVKAVPPNDRVPNELLLILLRSNANSVLEMADEASHGTKRLTSDALKNVKMVVPLRQHAMSIAARFAPILHRIASNDGQTTSLAVLRDTLLPKLISGELRIKDAERIVGNAT